MDAQYLKESVGPALAKGLAATSLARPQDPIEYLANWLIKYVENDTRDKQVVFLHTDNLIGIVTKKCSSSRGAKKAAFRKLGTSPFAC